MRVTRTAFPTPREGYDRDNESQFRAQVDRAIAQVASSISGGPFVDVTKEPYNARGDGVTDVTAKIQAALDTVAAAGGGAVFLPAGTYAVTTLAIATSVTLMGVGWGAVLFQIASTSGDVINLASADEEYVTLLNFAIDGNKSNQSSANNGVYFDNSSGSFSTGDPIHRIMNLLVVDTKGSGIYLGAEARETVVSGCHVQRADKYGFRLAMTDSVIADCTSGAAGDHGFWCAAPNTRYIGCKAFGSGRLTAADGFNINQPRQTLVACESQDNERHGFQLVNATECTLTSCDADSNGRDTLMASAAGYGFRLDTSTRNTLTGCLAYNRGGGSSPQDYGIDFAGSGSNHVELWAYDNTSGTHTGSIGSGTFAIINGAVIAPTQSGTYSPTLTNVTNVSASTAFDLQWSRTGDVVTVSGKVDVDPTAAGATELGISLPIASNFTANQQCSGAGSTPAVAGEPVAILADTSNDRASMQWVAVDTANRARHFIFSYIIL